MQVLNRRHAELSADDLQQVRHWRARASRFAGRTALAEVVAMGYTMDAALYEGKLAKAWLAHDRAHDILINTPTSKLPIGPELMHNAIDGARVTAMMPRSAARLARAILWQYRIRQAVRWTNKHDPVHRQEVRAIKQARRHEAKSREHVVDSVRKHV